MLLIGVFEGNKFEKLKELKKLKNKQPNFGWLHRPKKELEDLIKKIEDDKDLDLEDRTKIIKANLGIMTGKRNNKKDANDYYLNNIFGYKKALAKTKGHPGSRTQRVKNFIGTHNGVEYTQKFLETEIKKLDVETGGKDDEEPPKDAKTTGYGL